ncbi:hypothetical protein LAV84_22695 [Rhizobium sp. VS19-DR104.2]|uniref:DUF6904 family protein n=1 Tax=unclassified Rhizobium TaxID=2613769 RepID=UPI001CC7385D|nr:MULTISPECIES: hypothetical protein [unclassified Rhizobium]MBZ5761954.1 hypothetical protein [Rhizobium sp. VS19-DR96]MBZ5768926.1 hypothetical protein [Rhizobium sp. VS19-DR129.2]MBZ5775670.1 hypothetical protein [Rhizobium sp. VS19-DRK62.2]MBZ5786832.1 hypothetical protein [Rhizobium sp. VS19-DR121]MBZ5805042.1 hypothetical protein [Rhizobium sp. VS19-DR181]
MAYAWVRKGYDRSPFVKGKESSFLGLAYDVRKAYERQREIIQPPKHSEEVGVRYGVQILWPVLMLQQRLLRQSLAFLDHKAKTQAIAYALEAVIEDRLREDFRAQAGLIVGLWQRLDPAQPEVFDMMDSRGGLYCSWTKTQRKAGFAQLLANFDSMYERFYPMRLKNGDENLISPAEFAAWENAEWPDPRW